MIFNSGLKQIFCAVTSNRSLSEQKNDQKKSDFAKENRSRKNQMDQGWFFRAIASNPSNQSCPNFLTKASFTNW